MARKINVKLIMELRDAGLSRSTIASTRHISRHSVSEVFNIADEKGIHYNDVRALEEPEVYRLFYPEKFANSVWIDLSPSEEDLLMNMKQRTRYKVRLAEKKGVTVRHGTSTDFENLYAMYAKTSERDQFIIREKAYYLNVWNRFYDAGMLTPLIAETEGQAIAALMLFTYAQRSWYIYGMSTDRHREKMPNYLLQWEAIKTAKQAGSRIYDLWGAPDIYDESDRMWGVYQFKQGFGGFEVNTPGAWDLPLHKTGYHLFVRTLPAFLAYLKRKK